MLDTPVDSWYVWVGLAVVAAAALGTASAFPTAPSPDASAAAIAVERVAAADHAATARERVDADAALLEPDSLSLRDDGRTTHATLSVRVTPVRRGTPLWRLLRGGRPAETFDDPAALENATRAARDRPARWRETDRLLVRTITWEDVDVTLVGA